MIVVRDASKRRAAHQMDGGLFRIFRHRAQRSRRLENPAIRGQDLRSLFSKCVATFMTAGL